MVGEPGVPVGNRIGFNGSNLVDWYNRGNVPVRIPLFSGSCSGGYNIAGFGCFVLTSPDYQDQLADTRAAGSDLRDDNR